MSLKKSSSKTLWLKTKKTKLVCFLTLIATATGCAVVGILLSLSRLDYVSVESPTFEVNSEESISSLFEQINGGTIENSDDLLDTAEIGEKTQEATLVSRLGTKQTVIVLYNVNDTIAPEIIGESELSFKTTDEVDILSNYKAEDNSKKDVELSLAGDYNLNKAGEYKVSIIATDASGNTSSKEVKLIITEPPRSAAVTTQSAGGTYYIEVNREQNVVIVYSKGQGGGYTNIAKVFVASTGAVGSETPLGTFTTTDRYETLLLVGNVWGHYTVRINGHIFFHSVPYFSKGSPWNDLEFLEYNKLGSGASAGCVRLAASDAKWIYDNIPYGTTVKIYDAPSLPTGVIKPSPIKIDENSPNRGWDPTDPDPNNPWR